MLKPERGAPGSVRDTLSKEKVCVNSEDDALGVHQIHKDPAWWVSTQNVEVSAKPGNDACGT